MELQELEAHIKIMLNAFLLSPKKVTVLKNVSVVFLVEDFGTMICGINRTDYSQVDNIIEEQFKGWRRVYITTQEDVLKKKYDVLWELMRGGYMKWLRTTHPRQVKNTLVGTNNLGTKLLQERLRIWAERPKYKYLIEDTKSVLQYGLLPELSHDPAFFDYMPEEVG